MLEPHIPPRRYIEFDDPALVARRAERRRRLKRVVWWLPILPVAIAGIFLVRRVEADRAQDQAYLAAIHTDLERLVVTQRAHHAEHGVYGILDDLGTDYVSSQGVIVVVHAADTDGWNASAHHLRLRAVCAISMGRGQSTLPDHEPNQVTCET